MKRAAILFILLGATQVFGGAWAQPKGKTYAKLSGIFYSTDEIYNDMGTRQTMGMDEDEFTGDQAFLYVEHGLRERVTVIGQLSGGILTATNRLVRQRTRGIGDAQLGVKVQVWDKPVVLSPMLSVKIPTGYHSRYEPPLGTGDADLEARLLAARSLWPLPVYLGVESGYRLRGGPFSNQFVGFAEVGGTPTDWLFVKGFLDYSNTLTGDEEATGLVGVSQQVSEGDITNVGLNGAVRIGAGVWLDVLVEWSARGENVGAGASWGIGLSYGG